MKKKKEILILGSTGSIGKSLINILKKYKSEIKINLLSTNTNLNEISKQSKFFNVKNLIISDYKTYIKAKKIFKNKNIKILNNFKNLKKIIKSKADYVMSSISGLEGLIPTYEVIKFTKTIAIANKESIICGWEIIKNEAKKNNTKIIPVDSEHFSIWSLIGSKNINQVDKIYITASGGPFLNKTLKDLKNIKINDALKHPNWSMGKKISVDSATMMNKVFEVIETNRLFDFKLKNIIILIHKDSYLHAVVSFKSGIKSFLVHETDMRVPIYNSLFFENNNKFMTKNLDINKVNNLKLKKINSKRFSVINILNKYPEYNTLFDTVLVTVNDKLVYKFLKQELSFLDISKFLVKIINLREFRKYRYLKPNNIKEIIDLSKYVGLKVDKLCVKP
jgi:1-deoxy-D-xylulose-5-phosphate reductoisomerase